MGKRFENYLQEKTREKENSILREKMGNEIERTQIESIFSYIQNNKAGFNNINYEY